MRKSSKESPNSLYNRKKSFSIRKKVQSQNTKRQTNNERAYITEDVTTSWGKTINIDQKEIIKIEAYKCGNKNKVITINRSIIL